MNKIFVDKDIETQKSVDIEKDVQPKNVYNYNINIGKKYEPKPKTKVKPQVETKVNVVKTDLDVFLEQKQKENLFEDILEEEVETMPEETFEEEYQEYSQSYSKKSIMPVIGIIIIGLLSFLGVYNAVSYVNYKIELQKIENGITLQDGKISQLASKIDKLTDEEIDKTLQEQGYEKLPIEETELIKLNPKNTPNVYEKQTNWFDWFCNILSNFND